MADRQLRGCVIWTHRARACGGCGLVTGGRYFYVHRRPVLVMQQSLSPCVPSSIGTKNPTDTLKQLLGYIATSPWPPQSGSTLAMWSNLLMRSCWLTGQLLDPYHSWHVTATPTLTKSLCCIFVRCMMDGSSTEGKSGGAQLPGASAQLSGSPRRNRRSFDLRTCERTPGRHRKTVGR